jgi:hypothetical protein
MLEIASFLGICIYMYYKDHAPAHFHAIYGDYAITVEIESGIIDGKFPKRALSAVLEWLDIYKSELLENWELVLKRVPLKKIKPLE